MADYSKFFRPGEQVTQGTAYPSGLTGPKRSPKRQNIRDQVLGGFKSLAAPMGEPERGPGVQDDLGIGVKQRAAEHRKVYEREHPVDLRSPAPAMHTLPDPQWEGFFQALRERGVTGLRGGQSPAGSNQLVGTTTQPDYFTGGDTFMGRPTAPTDISRAREAAEGPFGKFGQGPATEGPYGKFGEGPTQEGPYGKFGAGTGGQSASLLALKRTSRGRRNG